DVLRGPAAGAHTPDACTRRCARLFFWQTWRLLLEFRSSSPILPTSAEAFLVRVVLPSVLRQGRPPCHLIPPPSIGRTATASWPPLSHTPTCPSPTSSPAPTSRKRWPTPTSASAPAAPRSTPRP